MRLALILLALLFAAPAAATQVGPPLPLHPDPSVPIERGPDSRVAAQMYVNGLGPFRFIIDTGANRTAVSSALAGVLGLPVAESRVVNGVTGAQEMRLVAIDRLKGGALDTGPFEAPVVSGLALGDADGLLAARDMLSARVVLNFERNRYELQRSRLRSPPSGATALPARLRFGQLAMVDCLVARVRARCILDTGSTHTVINSALYARLRARGGVEVLALQTAMFGVTEHVIRGDIVQVPSLTLGRSRFDAVNVLAADAHVFEVWGLVEEPAMLLGMNVLRAFDLLAIDYPTRTVFVRAKRPYVVDASATRIRRPDQ